MTKIAGASVVTLQILTHLTRDSVTYQTRGSTQRIWLRQSSCPGSIHMHQENNSYVHKFLV